VLVCLTYETSFFVNYFNNYVPDCGRVRATPRVSGKGPVGLLFTVEWLHQRLLTWALNPRLSIKVQEDSNRGPKVEYPISG
jgi:hypothetical protein